MSLAHDEDYASVLSDELGRAGMPRTPLELVGRVYMFGCEHGSHHDVHSGTVLSVRTSDLTSGLCLGVSGKDLFGGKILEICHSNNTGTWFAAVQFQDGSKIRYDGELRML